MGTKILFIYLPYLTAAIFLGGIAYRLWKWSKTPVPLRIVLTPAPQTRFGVAWRLLGDVLWFPSLFKSDRLLWAGGLAFHVLLWLVLLRHLRYFFYPLPSWIVEIQTLGLYAGYFLPLPVFFLLIRRLTMERIIYITVLEDLFALLLLLAVSVTGVLLTQFFRSDVVEIKAIILGLLHLRPIVPDVHWLFALHFFLVMVLIGYFPLGKLMHAGGLFLSPTHNQRANFTERFVNPWDFPVAYNEHNLFPPEKYREMLSKSSQGSPS
jgi:nitrate reductase gamma subunit